MSGLLFSDFGVEIFERLGRYFLRFDTGRMGGEEVEFEISAAEAAHVQRGAGEAGQIVSNCLSREAEQDG